LCAGSSNPVHLCLLSYGLEGYLVDAVDVRVGVEAPHFALLCCLFCFLSQRLCLQGLSWACRLLADPRRGRDAVESGEVAKEIRIAFSADESPFGVDSWLCFSAGFSTANSLNPTTTNGLLSRMLLKREQTAVESLRSYYAMMEHSGEGSLRHMLLVGQFPACGSWFHRYAEACGRVSRLVACPSQTPCLPPKLKTVGLGLRFTLTIDR